MSRRHTAGGRGLGVSLPAETKWLQSQDLTRHACAITRETRPLWGLIPWEEGGCAGRALRPGRTEQGGHCPPPKRPWAASQWSYPPRLVGSGLASALPGSEPIKLGEGRKPYPGLAALPPGEAP